ncbi:proline-rich transmembrane protein 4-like isoform X1 [Astyanax mexicanus]|uniref:Proline-rich transmembrane protein 4-like isoform X1 n=1 Tax=Astyanax mexicanus TaxID=7994 RepID=A0A8T2LNJ9_ASTMX|nr:proline-rich transmembrane protein 4-like isoform X1 [Astyanax mexicanus]
MVLHSGGLNSIVLVLSLSLFDSLHTVSLNRDGREPSWTKKTAVSGAQWSQWTTQMSRTKMDTTTASPMINSLFTELTIKFEKNSNALKDLAGTMAAASNLNSRRNISLPKPSTTETWTANDTPAKAWSRTQGNEWIPVKEFSDLAQSYLGDFDAYSSERSDSQAWKSQSGFQPQENTETPEFTHVHMSQTSPDQRRVKTKLGVDSTQRESKSTGQKTDIGKFSDAGTDVGQEQKDLLTTAKDTGKEIEESTTKPPQQTIGLTSYPKESLMKPNWTRPSLDTSKEDGVGPLEEERKRKQDARMTPATTTLTLNPGLSVFNTDATESSSLPDCNQDSTGICNSSKPLRNPGLSDDSISDDLAPASPVLPPSEDMTPPPVALTPPLLVPLLTDWNAAMATWGLAWELQVYGLGCVFSLVAMISALSLLCLPLCWPSGCAQFSLLHLLQLLAGSSRALWLLYDPYGQRERLPAAWVRLLHEATYPCLTAAFGLLLLLLCGLSPSQLLSQSTLRRCGCLLAALVLVHVAVVMGSVAILRLFPTLPVVPLLPPAAFLLLASIFSFSYLLFYCCTRTDAKHIYRLSETSPDHQANRCPLAEASVWERAAGTGLFAALFLLACGGLRLYAILHATGLTDEETVGLMPWPWWGFQLSCRVCEVGVCLSVALVITHPLLCCGRAAPKFGRWSSMFNRKRISTGGTTSATKPTILPTSWSKRPGEKLSLRDGMVQDESESVPLYTLAEVPLCEMDGLDLHYPSSPQNQALLQHSATTNNAQIVSRHSSLASLNGDSTVDLRPPSPIDLRRSIDEALNSEALFRRSLFSSSRLSLSTRGPPDGQPCRGTSAEPVLYRTASCGDVDSPCRDSISSSLHGGPRGRGGPTALYSSRHQSQSSLPRGSLPRVQSGRPSQKQYKVLNSTASRESIYEKDHAYTQADELAVQAEFKSVCRQIDALSVSSDTIEL